MQALAPVPVAQVARAHAPGVAELASAGPALVQVVEAGWALAPVPEMVVWALVEQMGPGGARWDVPAGRD